MGREKRKRQIVGSSAVLLSLIIHIIILSLAGGIIALKYFKKKSPDFQIEEKKSLELRKLEMSIETKPFIEQMSKPQQRVSKKISTSSDQFFEIPEQGEFIKIAPMPSFKGSYTNFTTKDRRLTFNSKYRDIDFGISKMDFFGTKATAEKMVLILDVSKNIVHDRRGGLEAFNVIKDDFNILISDLRPSTLFNVILFDQDNIQCYNQDLIPATAIHKTNVLEWIGNINYNTDIIGLNDSTPTIINNSYNYNIPLNKNDINGWFKALQKGIELNPDIFFILVSNWGNITDNSTGVSYFAKKNILRKYLKQNLEYILKDDDNYDYWNEMVVEINDLKPIALKMIELENQERDILSIDHKIMNGWEEILLENDVEFPYWDKYQEPKIKGILPSETRYTIDEVLESLFIYTMSHYRQNGFPRMNFILADQSPLFNNGKERAALMTSRIKFFLLTRMIKGRFRVIESIDPVKNELNQNIHSIQDLFEENAQED